MTALTVDADLGLKLHAGLGGVAKSLDRQSSLLRAALLQQPVWYHPEGSVVIPASGFAVIPLGGPDQGHMWVVRAVLAGGTTLAAAVGSAFLFASSSSLASQTSVTGIPLTQLRDVMPAMPNIRFHGSGEITLTAQEEAHMIFTGATVGAQYVAALQVEDIQEGARRQDWSV